MTTTRTHADGLLVEESLTRQIIGAFYYVYDRLGFGFLEAVYRRALAFVLRRSGLKVDCERIVDVWSEGEKVGHYRADLVVEDKVIVEIKASERLVEADRKQLLNYLRASRMEVGLLLNFGPKAQFERRVYSNANKPMLVGE
jgi:GxxExxY protein